MSHPVDVHSASTPSAETTGAYKWLVVGMLWFICFFNYADRQAMSAILPALEKEFDFNKKEQGLISSAFSLVYAATAPFAGMTSDRFSRKWLIIGGLYVWSLITGFTALCNKLWQFVLVRGGEGLGETFYFPASMSLVSDYHGKRTRSLAMGLHQTSVYAGIIGGSVLAGWMTQVWNWRVPFVVLGAGGMILGLVLSRFIIEPQRNRAELVDQGLPQAQVEKVRLVDFFAELANRPTAFGLAIAFIGANGAATVVMTWMTTFLHEKFHMELVEAAFTATFYFYIASMFGSAAGGYLADIWARRSAGGRILVQALGAFAAAPLVYLSGTTGEKRVLIAVLIAFGLAKGIYDSNIWASLYEVVPAARRSTAVGLMNMVGWLGGFVGPLTVGVLVDAGWKMGDAIASLAIVYLVVAAVLGTCGIILAPRDVQRVPTTD